MTQKTKIILRSGIAIYGLMNFLKFNSFLFNSKPSLRNHFHANGHVFISKNVNIIIYNTMWNKCTLLIPRKMPLKHVSPLMVPAITWAGNVTVYVLPGGVHRRRMGCVTQTGIRAMSFTAFKLKSDTNPWTQQFFR